MVTKRLKEFIDNKGVSVAAFEKSIGMSNASFGKSLKNNGNIGSDKLEIILGIYPDLNSEWLLTGKGNMIINEGEVNQDKRVNCSHSIPFYNIPVSAGSLGLIISQDKSIEPDGYCDLDMFIGCEAILPVVGVSMEPIIRPGDYIGIKRIILKNGDLSFLRTGYIYLIITCDDRMIKFIEQSDDANYIVCKSPNHAPFKVLKEDILEVHMVKAVSKNLM